MDGKKKLDELVAGLDGVTPGPWRPSRFGFQIVSDFPEAAWQSVVELRTKACSFPHAENEMKSQETIANHLARCDPDTIRSISDAFKAITDHAERVEVENDQLRKIISECADALGNGAHIDPGCTVEFMGELPREIELRIAALRPAILEEAAQKSESLVVKGLTDGRQIASAIRSLATTGQEGGR